MNWYAVNGGEAQYGLSAAEFGDLELRCGEVWETYDQSSASRKFCGIGCP